jgi:type I restriction enzyme S subunit
LRQPHVLDKATGHFTGSVGQQRLPDEYLADLTLPLPPLPEQKRIVAVLQEQMTAVERARAAAEARLKAAEALPDAYKRGVFEGASASEWPVENLGEASEVVGGIQKTPDRAAHSNSRPYLTVRNVQRGSLDLSQVEQFEVTPKEVTRLRLLDGDILIVEGNGSIHHIGRNALFVDDGQEWIHQNHIIRVRLDRARLLPEFVSRFLNSEAGRAQMVEKARTSSGLFTLSAGKVKSLEVPAPDIDTQREVTLALQKICVNAAVLADAAKTELEAINAMPAALLRNAFRDSE